MDELAKRFTELSEKYGPQVVDAVLSAARMEAVSTIVAGLMAIGVAACMLYGGKYFYNKSQEKDWDEDWIIIAFILWGFAIIPACLGVWSIIDPWTWTALSHPELWIAKKVFHL